MTYRRVIQGFSRRSPAGVAAVVAHEAHADALVDDDLGRFVGLVHAADALDGRVDVSSCFCCSTRRVDGRATSMVGPATSAFGFAHGSHKSKHQLRHTSRFFQRGFAAEVSGSIEVLPTGREVTRSRL